MKQSIDKKDPVLFKILEGHSDLVLVFHVDGTFIFANQRAHKILDIANDLKKDAILSEKFNLQVESYRTEVVTDDNDEPCYTIIFATESGDRITPEQKLINIHLSLIHI